MRKESSTVQKCKRQMATLGFDSQLAYHRVKLILKIYRDVVWVLSERVEELHEYAWELGDQDADTGLIYLQSFAPDMDLQEFEERVCCVMENRMLVDVIDRALLRLKRYPDRGELYYEILTKQFIHRFNSTEKELLDTSSGEELLKAATSLYDRIVDKTLLARRLTLCANHLLDESSVPEDLPEQIDLFTDYSAKEKQKKEADTAHARERKLQKTMLGIKKRFGKNAILKGLNLEDGATARERNNQIGGHKA